MKKKSFLFVLYITFVIYMICGCASVDEKNDSANAESDYFDKILFNTAKKLIEAPKRKSTFTLEEDESEITDADYNRDEYYISITVSEETEDGGLFSAYCYDLGSDESRLVWQHDNISQYAVMIYDWHNNKVYYLENEGFDENMHLGCDSICSYDLSTGSRKVLTDAFYAINYMIPAGDKLNIVAAARGERQLSLFQYDEMSGEVTKAEELDEGLDVWNISYSPISNKGVIAGYLEDEKWKNLDQSGGSWFVTPADRYIYTSDDGFSTLDYRFKTDQQTIDKLAVTPKGKFYFTKSDSEVCGHGNYYTWYAYANGNKAIKESYFKYINDFDMESHYLVFMDDVHLYCIGSTPQEGRGIYCYNVKEQTAEKLFSVENGYINNFVIIKK